MVKGKIMKRLFASLLLLPALCFGAGSDLVMMQRLPDDSSSINRIVAKPAGTADGLLGYLGSTQRPYFLQLGQGLQLASGVLSSTVSAGPAGPVGPKGDQGAQGIQGIPGVAGSIGATGPSGSAGATGPAGAASTVPGPQGPAGPAGADGQPGATGATGAVGPASTVSGPQGVAGPAGAQGPTGLTGPSGAAGSQGPIGLTGATGATGAAAPLPSGSVATRALNIAFQPSVTRPVLASYSVDIGVTSVLLAGTQGAVTLQYADNAAMTTNVVAADSATNSTGGVLNVTNIGTVKVLALIPAGKYVRILTTNTLATPTFTYRSGQEITF